MSGLHGLIVCSQFLPSLEEQGPLEYDGFLDSIPPMFRNTLGIDKNVTLIEVTQYEF